MTVGETQKRRGRFRSLVTVMLEVGFFFPLLNREIRSSRIPAAWETLIPFLEAKMAISRGFASFVVL